MNTKQINSEIEYRLAKWLAFNMLQKGIISAEEYEKRVLIFCCDSIRPQAALKTMGIRKIGKHKGLLPEITKK